MDCSSWLVDNAMTLSFDAPVIVRVMPKARRWPTSLSSGETHNLMEDLTLVYFAGVSAVVLGEYNNLELASHRGFARESSETQSPKMTPRGSASEPCSIFFLRSFSQVRQYHFSKSTSSSWLGLQASDDIDDRVLDEGINTLPA